MALLMTIASAWSAHADCPAAPIGSPHDLVVSFLSANGTQVGPASELPSSVKDGMLVYDHADNTLRLCDGTTWQTLTTGSGGSSTLAGLSDVDVTDADNGKILVFDSSAGKWVIGSAPATGAAGADREIQFNDGGAFGASSAFKLMADGDLLLTGGPISTSSAPALGAGTRMFFDAQSGAFRAGNVSGTQWDSANVGNASTALGNDATASGLYSVALGSTPTASGPAGIAIGHFAVASGMFGTAIGRETRAIGGESTAIGSYTTASGSSSSAMGRRVVAGTGTANDGFGDASMAIGLNVDADYNYPWPQVKGTRSMGVFMGDQSGVVLAANNQASFLGGRMVIDPAAPATHLTASAALDVAGTIKIGSGGEACDAGHLGAIRYVVTPAAKFQFCIMAGAWTDIGSPPATGAAGSAAEVQFRDISTGALAANANFVFDTTSTRLGIGTATPSSPLYVVGTPTDLTVIRAVGYNADTRIRIENRAAAALSNSTLIDFGLQSTLQLRSFAFIQTVATDLTDAARSGQLLFSPYYNGNPTAMLTVGGANANIGVYTTTPAASAAIDINSTTKGFLPPRMTTTQRDDIASPATGLMIYNTTSNRPEYFNGSAWQSFGESVKDGLTASTAGLSCKSILAIGVSVGSRQYWIDPDGVGGNAPFQAYCDMTTDGGGWTVCAAIGHLKKGADSASGFNYLNTSWSTAGTVFLNSTGTVQSYGNFCHTLAIAEVKGQARSSTSAVQFTTTPIAVTANPFISGANVRYSVTGGAFGVATRTAYGPNFYIGGTCTSGTNSYTQGTVLCVGNGSVYQAAMGNINSGTSLGDYMCAYNTQCGTGTNQTIVLFAR